MYLLTWNGIGASVPGWGDCGPAVPMEEEMAAEIAPAGGRAPLISKIVNIMSYISKT